MTLRLSIRTPLLADIGEQATRDNEVMRVINRVSPGFNDDLGRAEHWLTFDYSDTSYGREALSEAILPLLSLDYVWEISVTRFT